MSTAAPHEPAWADPTRQVALAIDARGWDLHVERAGPFARAAAGEGEPLWVASVNRGGFALEAQGASAPAAIDALWSEIQRHCRRPAHLREESPS